MANTTPSVLFDGSVWCDNCGRWVAHAKCRLLGKSTSMWRCYTCHSKHQQLYRALGSWPQPAFKALPKEQQQQFYQEIDSLKGSEIQITAQQFLTQVCLGIQTHPLPLTLCRYL